MYSSIERVQEKKLIEVIRKNKNKNKKSDDQGLEIIIDKATKEYICVYLIRVVLK